MLHHLFHLGISPWEKALRTIVVYLVLLVLIRLGGKRQLAQLNSFDLVVLLLLSNVVQNAVIGEDASLAGGALGAAILVAGNYTVVRYVFRHPRFGPLLQGAGTVLARDGEVEQAALDRELITRAELDAALRRQGFEGIAGTEQATLEPEGAFSAESNQPSLADVLHKLEQIEQRLASSRP